MIDTHAHIDTDAFDSDRTEMIERAFESGVKNIIIPAIMPSGFHKVLELTERYGEIYCGIGIHPHNASEATEENLALVKELAQKEKVVAIGETGLDYYYDFNPPEVMQKSFRAHMKIAKELGLPVIVHNRDSDDDLLRIIDEEQDGTLRGVLHCFSSNREMMEKAIKLGFNISFTGNITFKKFDRQDVVEQVPEGRFMIETDSPYMAPVPKRGKRNEPSYVRLVAEKIAEIKSISTDEVIDMTTRTAKELFRLPAIIMAILAITVSAVTAQDNLSDESENQPVYEHPFPKTIGLSFIMGTNTLVESYKFEGEDLDEDISYDGILNIGGGVHFYPLDFLTLNFSYTYTKNNKINENTDGIIPPTEIHYLEINSQWTPNPYNTVNFFAIGGVSFNLASVGQSDGSLNNEQNFALTGGVGFMINFYFDNIGTFGLVGEWRLIFEAGEKNLDFDPRVSPTRPEFKNPTIASYFYSIPRFSIQYYPDFFNF